MLILTSTFVLMDNFLSLFFSYVVVIVIKTPVKCQVKLILFKYSGTHFTSIIKAIFFIKITKKEEGAKMNKDLDKVV